MAFHLEPRDPKFLAENQQPNIGPGFYDVKSGFEKYQSRQ